MLAERGRVLGRARLVTVWLKQIWRRWRVVRLG